MIPQPIDQVPLFVKLAEDERELISSRLRHIEFKTNETIFASNTAPEFLGIIAQGWVKLESGGPHGATALANLGAGSVIGEVDLLLNRPHSTVARAAAPTSLLALFRQDLEQIILERPGIALKLSASLGARVVYLDEYLVTQRLSSNPLLGSLVQEDLRALAERLEFQSLERGQVIAEAGAPGDAVWLVEEGTARVIAPGPDGESFEDLGEGETFGQTALITGKPYAATASAVTELSLWVLPRSSYEELIQAHPTLKVAFSRALAENLGSTDQEKAVEQLRKLPLFVDVEEAGLREIAACLVMRHFPAGELVYGEGASGDAIYFIESGLIELTAEATPSLETINRKRAGDFFGEMALLTGRTRSESAKALADTVVWALYKSDYDRLMVRHPSLGLALSRALSGKLSQGSDMTRRLQGMKLLDGLTLEELGELGGVAKPLRFHGSETICYAGQKAHYVYMIASGQVREIGAGRNGQAVVLSSLEAGDSFGERAVVQSTSHATTLQSVGDVECWTIAKPDFDHLLNRMPALASSVAHRMSEAADRKNRSGGANLAPPPPPMKRTATPPPPPLRRAAAPPHPPKRPAPPPRSRALPPVGIRTVPGKPWERSSNSVMRPMPAANSRPVALGNGASAALAVPYRPAYAPPRPRPLVNQDALGSRIAAMSPTGKLKLFLAGFAVFFLMIVLPLLLILNIITQSNGVQSFIFGAPPTDQQLPDNVDGNPSSRAAMFPGSGKIAFLERTATPTPRPPTATPTVKATVKPTSKPAVRAKPAGPTATPAAVLAAAARPALPPRQWDPRLGPGGLPLLTGVGVTDAQAGSGQTFWRLVKMVFQDAGAESGNDHTIYISIIDENGLRVDDQDVVISWTEAGALQQQHLTQSDQKPAGDLCGCNYNFPLYGAGYSAKVEGSLASDQVYGMIMPEKQHVNYRLTFQRVVMP